MKINNPTTMQTYISLLRGINVSGQKKIKMEDLKKLYESLGFKEVITYIQSGNVIFSDEESDREKLVKKIESGIQKKYGFEVTVFVYIPDNFKKVIENQPFPKDDIKPLMVTFLDQIPNKENLSKLEVIDVNYEQYQLKGKVMYLYFPNGYGRAKMSNNFLENKLKVRATTRNWRTVNKLWDMTNL